MGGCGRVGRLGGGQDVDELPAAPLVLELDDGGDLGVEGVVLPLADVDAGEETGAALPDDDRAPRHQLSPEALDAQVLRVGVAAVAARALSFFMCHELAAPL